MEDKSKVSRVEDKGGASRVCSGVCGVYSVLVVYTVSSSDSSVMQGCTVVEGGVT